ncbi:MAG: DUF4159 domain-containing protein [Acidimicrobiia bacterium]|nr:DUF4159 domain-containing protein [Acidimicrobiia bacterium]
MRLSTTQRRSIAFIVTSILISLGLTVEAQRGFSQRRGGEDRFSGNIRLEGNQPYDGRFTFVRVSYQNFMSRRNEWSHDYPVGERHFMKILNEVSLVNPYTETSNVLALDNPELMKYPIAYMAEPGYWMMTEAELAGLTAYLKKGGFLIFDDFRSPWEWGNLELQMARIYPNARWVDLTAEHPIFHSFYDINNLDLIPQYFQNYGTPKFRGLFEDNDPSKRMIAIANFDTDISEFWEYADTGIRSVSETNEAFKLGVNYIIYALTH